MDNNQDMDAKMRRKIRELDMARRGFVIGFVIWCVLAFAFDSQGQQPQQWAVQPTVKLNNEGSPYASLHVESAIEEAVWAWSSRMPNMQIKYVGLTVAPVEMAVITYRWKDPLDMSLMTGSMFSKGAEQTWTYLDSGLISRSVIHLNTGYFRDGIDACEMTVFSHELGHALGIGFHSDKPEDLMYWAPSHCRYTPTDNDIALTGKASSTCHAVLTRDNDIAVPDIAGQQAYLKYQGNQEWKLEHVAEKKSRGCNGAQFNRDTGAIHLPDLRSSQHRYSATLESIGADVWRLNYAEVSQ